MATAGSFEDEEGDLGNRMSLLMLKNGAVSESDKEENRGASDGLDGNADRERLSKGGSLGRSDREGQKRGSDGGEDESIKCGYLSWRPECLQRFNNTPCLLFFFSLYALSLGFVVNGINNVNTTSIERRFNLSSATVGLVSSAYDVSAAILGVLISYFGAGRHKARMVGIAVIVSSLGSILMALPHFTTGPYSLGEDSVTSVCVPANSTAVLSGATTAAECDVGDEGHLSRYLYVFILGQLLHGVGGTTLYTVGVSLIDDSVKPSNTPLCLGILYGSAVLGPGMGYVVGGQFLSYYVDFDIMDTKMSSDDPRWVGAWWIGFILAAAVNLVVSIPILCFGAELPSAKEVRITRVSQAHTHRKSPQKKAGENVQNGVTKAAPEKKSLQHFVRTSLFLLSNPCFLFITMSMVTEGVALSGVATFMPKMIEKKFRVSASWAAVLSGLVVVPSAAGGQFLGGFVAKRLKLSIPGLIRLCILSISLSLVTVAIVWIDCGTEDFVGVTSHYSQRTKRKVLLSSTPVYNLITSVKEVMFSFASLSHTEIGLTSHCNAACQCITDVFMPVCDVNGTLFFSPCHAGCTTSSQDGVFGNCSCLATAGGDLRSATVQTAGCRSSCELLYPFLVLLFVLIGFNMIGVAPSDAIQLRCVPEENKTFAQGLKQMIVRLLGTVVGPVITGRLLDNTCQVWRQTCDGAVLSCWLYDSHLMSVSAYVGVAVTKVLSLLFCCLALWLYRPPLIAPPPLECLVDKAGEATEVTSLDPSDGGE